MKERQQISTDGGFKPLPLDALSLHSLLFRLLRTVPLILKHFYAVYDYAGKADLCKGYWNPIKKIVPTTHFLEIIKEQ